LFYDDILLLLELSLISYSLPCLIEGFLGLDVLVSAVKYYESDAFVGLIWFLPFLRLLAFSDRRVSRCMLCWLSVEMMLTISLFSKPYCLSCAIRLMMSCFFREISRLIPSA
jgi:hypothetical protein